MNSIQPISCFFPLDNLLEDLIEKKIVNIVASDLNGAIIDFDEYRGSYLKFTKTNFIQKVINAPLSDKHYIINFFVKFDTEQAYKDFFKLDEIFEISIDSSKNILVNNKPTNQHIETDKWYNFTIEIIGKNMRVLLFKDEIAFFTIGNAASIINDVKLAGTHISFSRWSIQDNFYSEEIEKIKLNQVNASEFDYTNIRFSLYNENTSNKNHLIIEDTEGKVQSLILEIDFGKHTAQLNDKLPIGIIKAKKGFFRSTTSLEENEYDWFIKIDKALSINNGNIQTYILENVEIINLADQDQVLLHLELFNIKVDGIDITEENSIKIDKTVLIQDNCGINICPFDCYIINGDTFTYRENYNQFNGQDLIIFLENMTDEEIVLSKDKAAFSIDLSRFNLFKIDKLQDKNITIKNSNGNTIINKKISQNNTKLEVCITQKVKLLPGNYLQFTISDLKVLPNANSVGKFPFYINYKSIDNYRNGKCKFIIESTIINKENYIGSWLSGAKNGYGVYTFANGDKYEGNWLNNDYHGYGVYITKSKDNEYTGYYLNNKKNGYGVKTDANGDKYEGSWLNNDYHGYGVYTFANGDKYEGSWLNNDYHGYGVYTLANGDKYEGNWLSGAKNGYGVYTFANGDKYEGNWLNNNRHGYGISNDFNSERRIHRGMWKDGLKEGYGEEIWRDLGSYRGFYSKSKHNGFGTSFNNSGYSDYGEWIDDSLVKPKRKNY
ncbi:hypothetical protein B4N84_07660 [Flavobacterium sp. IR1]|nr:hypothetical protein B4N84_07660 [Flavobacterium sp. IR1]